MGVNPEYMTLRQLLLMAEGRSWQLWDHTSILICTLVNKDRGEGVAERPVEDFHLHLRQAKMRERREPDIKLNPQESMDLLRNIVKRKG